MEPTSNVLTHSPDHPDIRRLSNLSHKMVAYMHDADAHDSHQKSEAFLRMRRLVQEHSVRNAHPLMRTKNVQRRQRHLALMPPWLPAPAVPPLNCSFCNVPLDLNNHKACPCETVFYCKATQCQNDAWTDHKPEHRVLMKVIYTERNFQIIRISFYTCIS